MIPSMKDWVVLGLLLGTLVGGCSDEGGVDPRPDPGAAGRAAEAGAGSEDAGAPGHGGEAVAGAPTGSAGESDAGTGGEGAAPPVEEPWDPDVSNGELDCGTPFIVPNRRLAKEILLAWDTQAGLSYGGGPLPQEVKQLKRLDLTESVGADLAGLECLTDLEGLSLYAAEETSLSGLSELSELASLGLQGPGVKDLSVLGGLAHLEELALSDTGLETLESLPESIGLVRLGLVRMEVSDLAPLSKSSELERLVISDSPVSDLTPLAALPRLEELELHHTAIGPSSVLDGFPALERLDLRENELEQLPDLTGLGALVSLDVSDNALTSLAGIGGPGLASLRSRGNPIGDWSALGGLPELESLRISGVEDSLTLNLDGLALATSLKSLSLSYVDASDLTFLKDLDALEELDIHNWPLSPESADLQSIASCPSLQSLSITGGGLTDLSSLDGNTTIEQLGLAHNELSDLTPLLSMTALKSVELTESLDCKDQATVVEPLRAKGVLVASSCDGHT